MGARGAGGTAGGCGAGVCLASEPALPGVEIEGSSWRNWNRHFQQRGLEAGLGEPFCVTRSFSAKRSRESRFPFSHQQVLRSGSPDGVTEGECGCSLAVTSEQPISPLWGFSGPWHQLGGAAPSFGPLQPALTQSVLTDLSPSGNRMPLRSVCPPLPRARRRCVGSAGCERLWGCGACQGARPQEAPAWRRQRIHGVTVRGPEVKVKVEVLSSAAERAAHRAGSAGSQEATFPVSLKKVLTKDMLF